MSLPITINVFFIVTSLLYFEVNSSDSDDYRLFGTKTIYENAIKFRDQIDFTDPAHTYTNATLEEEHKKLEAQGCKAITFFLLSRHGARYPTSEQIERYNLDLEYVKEEIRKIGSVDERLKPILEWQSKLHVDQDELLSAQGDRETGNVAERFVKLYPNLLSEGRIVQIGVTKAVRTSQTLVAFLKHLDNVQIDQCPMCKIPTNDPSDPSYSTEKIRHDECYHHLKDKNRMPLIEFYKQCRDRSSDPNPNDQTKLVNIIRDSRVFKLIAQRVAYKLGFKSIDEDVVRSAYQMCRFEWSIGEQESVWCKLFDRRDLEAFEFEEDVKDYTRKAYNPNRKDKLACMVIKRLLEAFDAGLNREQLSSYFYFGHEGAIKRLMPVFSLFKDDLEISRQNVEKFVQSYENGSKNETFTRNNEFRTSWLVPFGANYAFVQYKCPSSIFKLVATLNEKPIKLAGCNNQVQCDYQRFSQTYAPMRDCNIDEICKAKL